MKRRTLAFVLGLLFIAASVITAVTVTAASNDASDLRTHVSADQITTPDGVTNLAKFGNNDPKGTDIGTINNSSILVHGWLASSKRIVKFGYRYGDDIVLNAGLYATEQPVINAGASIAGTTGNTSRFRFILPINYAANEVNVVAQLVDGTIVNVWKIYYKVPYVELKTKVSADQVTALDNVTNLAKYGNNNPNGTALGTIDNENVIVHGWLASSRPIVKFGYRYGSKTVLNADLYTTEAAVINAGSAIAGTTGNSSRFHFIVPVDAAENEFCVVAKLSDGTVIDIWKITYTSTHAPVETEPVETEPVETEPIETEPVETEPVETEPVETEPIETEPVETEPVETEPVETEPIETEPVETEPVETEPVETEPSDDPADYNLKATSAEILIPGLSREYTFLHVTDLHACGSDAVDSASLSQSRLNDIAKRRAAFKVTDKDSYELMPYFFEYADAIKADMTVMTGDILDFPTSANINALKNCVNNANTPSIYILGNHDWTFSDDYQSASAKSKYIPMFRELSGGNASFHYQDLGEFIIVAIDNSTDVFTFEQYQQFRNVKALGKPIILVLHVPFYVNTLAPSVIGTWGRDITLGGNGMNSKNTYVASFYNDVAVDPNTPVVAVIAGHVHFDHVDTFPNGKKQIITSAANDGSCRVITVASSTKPVDYSKIELKTKTSADEIFASDGRTDIAKFGGNDPLGTDLGDKFDSKIYTYGWFASSIPTVKFGYRYGNKTVINTFPSTTEPAVVAAGAKYAGTTGNSVRFKVAIPIDRSCDEVYTVAQLADGRVVDIWKVTYSAPTAKLIKMSFNTISLDGQTLCDLGDAAGWAAQNPISFNSGDYNTISLRGWAYCSMPISGFTYRIDDGDSVSGNFIQYRADVKQVINSAAEGFNTAVDVSGLTSGTHKIDVYAVCSGMECKVCSVSLTVIHNDVQVKMLSYFIDSLSLSNNAIASGNSSKSYIEKNEVTFPARSCSALKLRGWVNLSTKCSGFGYSVDGSNIVAGSFGEYREDVKKVIGSSAEGYSIYADVSALGEGKHTVEYFAFGADSTPVSICTVRLNLSKELVRPGIDSDIVEPIVAGVNYNAQKAPYEDATVKMWFDHISEKVYQTDTNANDRHTYVMYMAGNSIEDCQFFLAPQTARRFNIAMTQFSDGKGHVLRTELFRERYYLADGNYIPDALPPCTGSIDVGAGLSQGFVIKVWTPINCPAGLYSAQIDVRDAYTAKVVKTATVYVQVWNFSLGEDTRMETAFKMNKNSIIYSYASRGLAYDSTALYKSYYDFMLENRICCAQLPYSLYDNAVYQYIDNPRVTSFQINNDSSDNISAARDRLSTTVRKNKGYFYFVDEPSNVNMLGNLANYASRLGGLEGFRMVSPFFTDITVNSTTDQVAFMSSCVNIWCTKPFAFTPSSCMSIPNAQKIQTAEQDARYGEFQSRMDNERLGGDKVWTYVCWEPVQPYCNWLLTNDGTECIVSVWQCRNTHSTGLLYWDTTYWTDGLKTTPCGIPVWGDGVLIHSGAEYGLQSPVSSLRLENIRDGIQDYQMLAMIEDRCGEAYADEITELVSKNVVCYTNDDTYLHAVRILLGDTVDQLY